MKDYILDELQNNEDFNSGHVIKLIGIGAFIWLSIQEFSNLFIWILRTMLLEVGIEPYKYSIMPSIYFLVMVLTAFIVVKRVSKMQLTNIESIKRFLKDVVLVFFVLSFFNLASNIYIDMTMGTPNILSKAVGDAAYNSIPYMVVAAIFWRAKWASYKSNFAYDWSMKDENICI